MKIVYLGLGSNLGDRERMLQAAVEQLHCPELRILRLSSVYETEPIDQRTSRWFLNLVAEAETSLFPIQLLGRTRKVETQLGRKRLAPMGPRTIDIDILLYGNFVVSTPSLVIPHAHLSERRFALAPMVELAPDLRHPVSRRSMRELLDRTLDQTIRKVAFSPLIP